MYELHNSSPGSTARFKQATTRPAKRVHGVRRRRNVGAHGWEHMGESTWVGAHGWERMGGAAGIAGVEARKSTLVEGMGSRRHHPPRPLPP
jgi:hypothetical protein